MPDLKHNEWNNKLFHCFNASIEVRMYVYTDGSRNLFPYPQPTLLLLLKSLGAGYQNTLVNVLLGALVRTRQFWIFLASSFRSV